jgi:KDO2-lipid IV(A) lauroyltransferase
VFRALKQQSIVAIVVDRAVTGQGIATSYFGQDFLAPDGHAVLARRFGAKIVPTYCMMQQDGRYRFFTDEPYQMPITDDAEADIRECVAHCLAIFEKRIVEYPKQWYAFRPTWEVDRTDRMQMRRNRPARWRRRSDKLAREAVDESHRLRQRARDARRGGGS